MSNTTFKEGHVYKCQWGRKKDRIFYNYVTKVISNTAFGGPIAVSDAACTIYSKEDLVDRPTTSCSLLSTRYTSSTVEDMGTYEEFINNYPELFI